MKATYRLLYLFETTTGFNKILFADYNIKPVLSLLMKKNSGGHV